MQEVVLQNQKAGLTGRGGEERKREGSKGRRGKDEEGRKGRGGEEGEGGGRGSGVGVRGREGNR